MRRRLLATTILIGTMTFAGQAAGAGPTVTTPRAAYGFDIGDNYKLANYTQMEAYWRKLAGESDRMKLVSIGKTAEGREQLMAIVSSPENLKSLDRYREIARRLAQADGLTPEQARALAREGKAVVWIDGGLHATETVGTQELTQILYEVLKGDDAETRRILDEVIILFAHANPDGMELVSDWYMANPVPEKREFESIPRLYHKYVGHDNNRDFFMSNMPETENINRILYREWFPQIVYNHHQSGPPGTVVFMPTHRDPYNFNLDPLVLTGLDGVGASMHARLIAEGKPGGVRRDYAPYTNWAGTTLRANALFHNSIGVITEIIGSPSPARLELIARNQLPTNDNLMPVAPQTWTFKQSIDYSISMNRAVLDYAARNRETLLHSIYAMAQNGIDKGSRDSWTVTPSLIAKLDEEAKKIPYRQDTPRWGMGFSSAAIEPSLYEQVLRNPAKRDPRGYILTADQADLPRVVVFMNALVKSGLQVERATAPFSVAGKSYPAGSFVVKTAQPYRAQVLDMFEAQDHPNDLAYPGGPPIPPHNVTGYTLAYQMGVKFDRILDGFEAPTQPVTDVMKPPAAAIQGTGKAGYLVSHEINNAFILQNRLLKAGKEVHWIKPAVSADGVDFAPGALWIPEAPGVRAVVEATAKEAGVAALAVAAQPAGETIKMKPIRIGLVDLYGGVMPSGWNRWLFETYEFPFEVVYPQRLDVGNLNKDFDVLVFADDTVLEPPAPDRPRRAPPKPQDVPAKYRAWLGEVSEDKTVPQLDAFVRKGGSIVAVGSATRLGYDLKLPISDALVETGADGAAKPLGRGKFYIPGSIMANVVDNEDPLAFGLPKDLNVYYYNSPAFKVASGATDARSVAYFSGKQTLRSGWAWGQSHLDGASSVVDASLGRGKVFLMGPEVTQLGQSQGTYKLLFNGLYYGPATAR
ncbi:M14 family zinc carboxypeptidase [Phenylobacterium sp. LjRoot164]|uniref:M14 family metallopeptidase n=1 Tax=unclassified Phenylobacterium TaxID=2640670 RepID=UPI003ECCB4A5